MAFSVEGSSSSSSATLTLFHARVTILFLSLLVVYAVLAAVIMNECACRDVINNGDESYHAANLD